MTSTPKIVPQFPACDLRQTSSFYQKLGFETLYHSEDPDPFLIIKREEIELHFWEYKQLIAEESNFSCYIRFESDEAYQALYKSWAQAKLQETGIPRLNPPQTRQWGMKEFYLIDPDGNLLKIGIESHAG